MRLRQPQLQQEVTEPAPRGPQEAQLKARLPLLLSLNTSCLGFVEELQNRRKDKQIQSDKTKQVPMPDRDVTETLQ